MLKTYTLSNSLGILVISLGLMNLHLIDGNLICKIYLYVEYLTDNHLAGVKVLHGLDKVVEGGTVVLTIKDQPILADGDINEGTAGWCTFMLFQPEV